MAVTHQLEITAQEAASALSTNDDIDAKTKKVLDLFKEKYGEITPEKQQEYTIASRVMVYYTIADPNSLRSRLASVLPGDTIVIGGDAPAWYYTLAIQQALKFQPGLILVQLDPENAVTVYSATVSDIATHVAPSKWMQREPPKQVEQAEQPAIAEEPDTDKPIEADG